ncbi:B-cell differentiation antigen CD72-like [Alligator sinensis]|uniref:B-cell differentiation antigen CD72-like n=1 Tax=Alligator sinensis TaxID=38654 RepID=A0A3Q0FRR5_ALLSI|nr:B-cell differentiation antigen CD72-like [Alligator sinensis]
MGESVTYADLQFSRAPPGWSAPPRTQGAAPPAPHEADSTYENLHLGPLGAGPAGSGAQQHRDPRWRARPLLLGLLAACLALLVTTIALGVCYGQQGQRLQQASRAHAAERHGLWQQTGAQEQQLGQAHAVLARAQEELAQTRVELAQEQEKGTHSQKELQETKTVLRETKVDLERAQEQVRNLQQQLDETARALASSRPCQVTDCCPETWVLHRGKCLFLSKEEQSWEQSKQRCEQESSQLLILLDQDRDWDRDRNQHWDQTKMPSFLTNTDASYWIGLWKNKGRWTWINKTPYPNSWKLKGSSNYGVIRRGSIETSYRYKHHWVCEKPASRPREGTEAVLAV